MKSWILNKTPFPSGIFISIISVIIFSNTPMLVWGQGKPLSDDDPVKLLTLNSKSTTITGETLMDLVIEDKKTIASHSFILYQNHPNPFLKNTTVAFELYEKTDLTLTIYDPDGKVIKEYEGIFEKGKNTIRIDGKDLNQYGVLYYQMTTPTQILSKKMIFKKSNRM